VITSFIQGIKLVVCSAATKSLVIVCLENLIGLVSCKHILVSYG